MPPKIHENLSRAELTKWALLLEADSKVTNTGALSVSSYKYTGRVPRAKRVVDTPNVTKDVDWGKFNIKMTSDAFKIARQRALDYLNLAEHLFIVNCFAGHDKNYRYKVRVVTTRAYHALFMTNMLIEPTADELAKFEDPDFTIYNAGECIAAGIPGIAGDVCVALNFETKEQIILGSQYAGEMKKGILTVMMYLMPKQGHLTMHASANEGENKDVTVFFGLSGTGKTTLSTDPKRAMIGDDEHVWTDKGVYNIEGGCYAKAIGLDPTKEKEIFEAVRAGAVAENCILDPRTNELLFSHPNSIENTRVAYPLSYIPGAKSPAVAGHPSNVIFLTSDAFGVLPPVAKLTKGQIMFWFITGYTSKAPGTEQGITEPQPTFSACFGGPFLVWHPTVYGQLLAALLEKHNANCWLVNTGYTGGDAIKRPGKDGKMASRGRRMSLPHTRAIIDAIHDGTLAKAEYETLPGWNLAVPKFVSAKVPTELLNPYNAWPNKKEFVEAIDKVAKLFQKNFEKYSAKASPEMLAAVPRAWATAPPSKL